METSVKSKKARMGKRIMPIKPWRAGWRRDIFQTQHHVWNCSWIPWKWKIISVMDTNLKCKKARMEEGKMPIKSLWAGWRREAFQTQYPMWNWSWLSWKWKIISVMDTSMKCKKARMVEGIVPIKSLCAEWRREILYASTISCLEFLIATMEKETIFWIVKKVNRMKPKSQDRRGDSGKRTKNAKTSSVKRFRSTTKDQGQAY